MEAKYGNWTVLSEAEPLQYDRSRGGTVAIRMIDVRCSCGAKSTVQWASLKHGRSKGCLSCSARKHLRRQARMPSTTKPNEAQTLRIYKMGARRRGLSFNLTREQFLELTSGDCTYCGARPGNKCCLKRRDGSPVGEAFIYQGIDREDSSKGYEPGNCVPCCATCNTAKGTKTLAEFQQWIHQVHQHLN